MPKTLTVPAIEKYRPQDERREIPDTTPGLRLVVYPSGLKSFALRFRRPDGRSAKLTLGTFAKDETSDAPVLGAPLTLTQARELANHLHRQRKLGKDIIEEHKSQKSRMRSEVIDRSENTFAKAALEFMSAYKTRHSTRHRRWRDLGGLLGLRWPKSVTDPTAVPPEIVKGGLADIWADKVLATIDGHDVHTVIKEAQKFGSAGRARHMHSALSTFFAWLVRDRRITTNPCVGVYHPSAGQARERVLTDAEIVKLWHAADSIPPQFGAALKVLLLTGQRRGEVSGMRRDELSEDGTWLIPGTRTKNHKKHVVPLSPLVREIIAGVPKIQGPYVFSFNGRNEIIGWSKAKQELDAALPDVPEWVIHDLRRTAASGMSRLGVRAEVIERALNHVTGSFRGVAGIYQRDPLSEEVQTALARWATHIDGLVVGRPAKVVAIRP
jgi:integrase